MPAAHGAQPACPDAPPPAPAVLYRPAPHTVGTHTDPSLDATSPTGHTSATGATHPDKNAVPASLNLPAGHGRQALLLFCPSSGWKWCAGHCVQLKSLLPVRAMNVPAAHGTHCASIGYGPWVPAAHGRHASTDVCPSRLLLVPGSHRTQRQQPNHHNAPKHHTKSSHHIRY